MTPWIEIGVVIVGVVLGLKAVMPKADILKGLRIKAGTAGLLAIVILAAGAIYYNWGNNGIMNQLQGVTTPNGPVTPTGVLWSSLGSTNDTNVTYNGMSRTFSTTLSGQTSDNFIITVYRDDLENVNAVAEVKVLNVPTFRTTGLSGLTYSIVAQTTEGLWDITVQPIPSGNARYSFATAGIAAGGSQAFAVTVTYDNTGISNATSGSVSAITFDAMGTQYTLSCYVP